MTRSQKVRPREPVRSSSRFRSLKELVEFKPKRTKASISLNAPEHANRIRFDTVKTTESVEIHTEISEMVVDLASDFDWIMLGELLEEWDQKRARCPSNRRLMQTAISDVISHLLTGMPADISGGDHNAPRLPDAFVLDLEDTVKAKPKLYALAALAAQMRLSQAWDMQGTSGDDRNDKRARGKMGQCLAHARAMLDLLDAKDLNSPLAAMIHSNILPFLADPSKRMIDSYKDWICLDPGDLTPHRRMGQLLSPAWFGDFEAIERTALQAVTWTEHETGAAAYAVVYLSALKQDRDALAYLDPVLFAEGIEDLVNHRRRDPTYVPGIVCGLWQCAQWRPKLGLNAEARKIWARQTERMGELAMTILMRHLTAIHAHSWAGGLEEALHYISLAAQSVLEDGATLRVSRRGITRET